jgi:hypothetical protein
MLMKMMVPVLEAQIIMQPVHVRDLHTNTDLQVTIPDV